MLDLAEAINEKASDYKSLALLQIRVRPCPLLPPIILVADARSSPKIGGNEKMSIEKLDDLSRTIIEQNPYAQILNEVIEHIKDNDAFRIYAYSYSKSRDWKVIKEYTQKKCGIGDTKAKACWSYLKRCGLIQYVENRNEKGQLKAPDIMILNGTKFDKNEPFKAEKKLSTEKSDRRVKNPPGGKTTRLEKRVLLKKENTNKEKRERATTLPEDFRFDQKQINVCNQRQLDPVVVFEKFRSFMKSREKKSRDWVEEANLWIMRENFTGGQICSTFNQSNESRSTVKFWEAGNPDYDRIHGIN